MLGDSTVQTGTANNSTDSQGSGPLSDPFVAVAAGPVLTKGSRRRVKAPAGSSQMEVRRSGRTIPPKKFKPALVTKQSTSTQGTTDSLPDGEHQPSNTLQVLPVVGEGNEEDVQSAGSAEKARGLRDTDIPQPNVPNVHRPLTGRKRSASSAILSPGRRDPTPRMLASAADFSPTHFEEPLSDNGLPPPLSPTRESRTPLPRQPYQSPMHVDVPVTTPASSPVSQNPLFQKPRSVFRTRDSGAAWNVAEGMLPISEGFTAPGFVHNQVVGGISFKVHSPHARPNHPPSDRLSGVGRQLFAEHHGSDAHTPGIPHPHQEATGRESVQRTAYATAEGDVCHFFFPLRIY